MTDSVAAVASLLDRGLDNGQAAPVIHTTATEGSPSATKRDRTDEPASSRSRSSRRSRSGSRDRDRKRHRRRRSRSRDRGGRSRRRGRSRSRSRDRDRRSRRRRSESPDEGAFEKKVESAEERHARDRIRDQCTVLVTMLPVKSTARDIATYFSQCGTVRDVKLIKDRKARQHKGFSYVEFETPEEATGALRLTGALFQGRSLVVQPTHNERNRAFEAKQNSVSGVDGTPLIVPMKVYVGSLHFNVTEDALQTIFQPFGRIMDVTIHRDTETKESRGFGFVTFYSQTEARRAMNELNGLEILGRPMKVGEPRESGQTASDSAASGVDPASNVAESEALAAGDQLENDDHLVLNQATRALLMAKLQREGHEADQTQILTQIQQSGIITTPSKCLVIQNAFDAAAEDAKPENQGWELEIQQDVEAECSGFGRVEHIQLEKTSGCIYLKYADIQFAMAARLALNGRFFGGQTISVEYVTLAIYQKRYGGN